MARTIVTHVTDDIDGSSNAEEVHFGYNGTDFVIDLSKKNRSTFEKALKPYLDAARKAPKSAQGRRRKSSESSSSSPDLTAVRTWAKQQGLEVSARGRVAKSVLDQYEAAQ